jgi:hypothetical protein
VHAATTVSLFFDNIVNWQGSAVLFMQWSEVECQKFITGGLLLEHTTYNLNVSDFTATDNVLVLPTE